MITLTIDWVSIVTAVLAFIGTLLGSYSGFKLTEYRVKQLELKVDKHNNFAERVPILEKDIKHIYHELDELKEK